MMQQRNRHIISDEQGGAFFLIAIMLVVIVSVGGMGVDFGRAQLVKHKMQQAVDAAALAGALAPEEMSDADKDAQVRKFFAMNFQNNFMQSDVGADNLNVQFIPSAADPDFVNVSVDDVEPTYFIKLLGFDELPIRAETQVSYIGDRNPDLDVVLAVDVSGSMASIDSAGVPRISGLRNASRTLLDLLYKDKDNQKSRVAIVAYDSSVDVETNLTSNYQVLTSIVNNMTPGSATAGGPAAQTASALIRNPIPRLTDGEIGETAAFVFLTDGTFNIGSNPQVRDEVGSKQMFRDACNELGNTDVLKFTISFGEDSDSVPGDPRSAGEFFGPVDRGILQDCVDTPQFYSHAATSQELEVIFRDILNVLRKVRIVK